MSPISAVHKPLNGYISSMDPSDREFDRLLDAAESAYARVQLEILDRLAPPARIDLTQLDANQRWALSELDRAESDISAYRERCYSSA
jgi:hypothetical protein